MRKRLVVVGIQIGVAGLLGMPQLAEAQPRPILERIEPSSGPPEIEVTLIGRGLGDPTRVMIGDTAVDVITDQPNRVVVRLPASASSGNVTIVTSSGQHRGPYFRVTETPPAPTISEVSPAAAAPGAVVTLRGTNFSARPGDNSVVLGDTPAVVRAATPAELHVTIPSTATSGVFTVRVRQAGEAESPRFTVLAPTNITVLTPSRVPPGRDVTISGTGFSNQLRENRIVVGGRPARVLRANEGELVVRVPRDLQPGPATLAVTMRGTDEETLIVQLPPRILEVTPASAAPGNDITVAGANFGEDVRAVAVHLADQPLTVRHVRDDRIIAAIPDGVSSGELAVRVYELTATARRSFEVLSPVTVTAYEPRSGPAGTTVRLTGNGFSRDRNSNTVTISGSLAQVVRASATELEIEVPTTQSGLIVVEVANNGEAATTSPFVVTTPPTIRAFSPRSGPIGSEVTLTGANFGTDPRLVRASIGETQLPIVAHQPTEMVVRIPDGAQTGRIQVTVGIQGSAATDRDFRVVAASAGKGQRLSNNNQSRYHNDTITR